jgi:hypothetical protein
MTSGDNASERYSVELVSRNPKWHFLRVVRTLVGYPYERPLPFEANDLREGTPTPRFKLLIREKATDRVLDERKLSSPNAANEAMQTVEADLEMLSVADFCEKYAIPRR